jgi:hypothetical protein
MKSTFLRLLGAAISGAVAAAAPRRKFLRVVDMSTILFLPFAILESEAGHQRLTLAKAPERRRPADHGTGEERDWHGVHAAVVREIEHSLPSTRQHSVSAPWRDTECRSPETRGVSPASNA